MRKCNFVMLMLWAVLIMAAASFAQEEGAEDMMGPMGPPPEMKEIAFLVGTWDVAMEWRMTPESEWIPSPGKATYMYVLDGAAMHMNYSGEMGPDMPPFAGSMIQCYNREMKKWQSAWVDNMAAQISYYTGDMVGDTVTLSGEDIYGGQKMLSRVRTFNHTETSFDWTMENSMDGGKTFWLSGKAKYTKTK